LTWRQRSARGGRRGNSISGHESDQISHFISQVEQRLNACNPDAASANQRIFKFEIVDRDKRVLRLSGSKGRSVENTLSMLDLFTFDIDQDKNLRTNFEEAFARYENPIRVNTGSILLAHSEDRSDIAPELFTLFVAKLVNFIRNPYSIQKALNTFGCFAAVHPTNPTIYDDYIRTMIGRQPHQAYLCRLLGISDDQYKTWLRLLFMLLTPVANGGSNFLEESIKSLFEKEDVALFVHVHKYNQQRCLLSDRGFSWPIEQGKHMVFDFNLGANAFIRYAFLDYETVLGRPMPEFIKRGLLRGPKVVRVSYLTNDLPALDVFHRRVIEQAHQHVYCSTKDIYTATVLAP
jgi:hypothetical protein